MNALMVYGIYMNKFKPKREEPDKEPNILHEDVSSQPSQRRAQHSSQTEQKYTPRHKKWPVLLAAGVIAAGGYFAGVNHQEVTRAFHAVEIAVNQAPQKAQAHQYAPTPVKHVEVVTRYVTKYVPRYVIRQAQPSPQQTAQQMQYNLQNRQLNLQQNAQSMQYNLQEQQLQAQAQVQSQQLALQQQQQQMQYRIQQEYAAQQGMQSMGYTVQTFAHTFNMLRGRY